MVVPDVLPKAVVFFLLIGGVQGLVAGETVLEKFPTPGEALDVSEQELCAEILDVEFCFPDFVAVAINFVSWPFEVAAWGFDLASLGFIEGMPAFVTLPLKLAALAVTAIGVAPLLLQTIDSLGQVIPFT